MSRPSAGVISTLRIVGHGLVVRHKLAKSLRRDDTEIGMEEEEIG